MVRTLRIMSYLLAPRRRYVDEPVSWCLSQLFLSALYGKSYIDETGMLCGIVLVRYIVSRNFQSGKRIIRKFIANIILKSDFLNHFHLSPFVSQTMSYILLS